MNIIRYTDDHHRFRERLQAFLEKEVTPYMDQWEQDHLVPKSVWRKMGQAGFLCTSIPETYGGLGGDFRYSVIVAEEISKCGGSGLAATLHSDVVVPYLASFGSEALKKKYLPGCVSGDMITAVAMTEPNAGSDVAGILTTAVPDGDEIVINGSKTFISNGVNCDLLVLAAKDPTVENKHQAISLYLVEAGTPGFKKGKQLEKMGWHSQDTAELFFNDCRIPKENILGEAGGGFLMLMQKLQQERLTCAIGAVAAAEQIMSWMMSACKEIMVNGKPLFRQQAVRFALVEMTTEVNLGRLFMETLVEDHVDGKQIIKETSMAKYWTTDMVNKIAERCLSILGGHGAYETCPIVRGRRDVRVMQIFAGTNEIMKEITAKFMGL